MEQQVDVLKKDLNTKILSCSDYEKACLEKQRIIDNLNNKFDNDYKCLDGRLKQTMIEIDYLSRDNSELKQRNKDIEQQN